MQSAVSPGTPVRPGVPASGSTPRNGKAPLGTGALLGTFTITRLDLEAPDRNRGLLPRKEVIQPQLPLRLPCYDFVPIIRPTFDGCLSQASWPTGFRCCRLS